MNSLQRRVGFTIIETMMFLAITGVLAVGILMGTGAAINQQRYRDSLNSLQSLVQEQYSKATDVANTRDASWRCDNAAAISQTGATEPRGTSDCIILGRLMSVDTTGQTIALRDVVGRRASGAVTQPSDVEELKTNYSITVSPIDADSQTMPWSTMVVKPKTSVPQPTTILIIRSPLSGNMLTFAAASATTDLKTLISNGPLTTPLDLCVDPGNGVAVAATLGVRIDAYAAGQSAVQVSSEGEKRCV